MADRPTRILICDDNINISRAIKSMIAATDAMMVLGEIAKRTTYEIKIFPHRNDLIQIANVEYGSYRQFEKRDKRKNFR